jgi:hypothetical protein
MRTELIVQASRSVLYTLEGDIIIFGKPAYTELQKSSREMIIAGTSIVIFIDIRA